LEKSAVHDVVHATSLIITVRPKNMPLEIPEYWRRFRDEHKLLEHSAEIPESDDDSDVGADIEFFDDAAIRDEMAEAYPGCIVAKEGFLPVGGCQIGSGDPYFIRLSEGESGALYRIYHDSVLAENYSKTDAADVVLSSFQSIVGFLT